MIYFLCLYVYDYFKVFFDKRVILFIYMYKGILLENCDFDKKINLFFWLCLWDEYVKCN